MLPAGFPIGDNKVMISGAPPEARWIRPAPRHTLPTPSLNRLMHRAFGPCHILEFHPLTDGLRNANFKILLDTSPHRIILRIYEHDPSLCQKEVDLIHLVSSSIPVPEIIHAEPQGLDELPPHAVMQFVEGMSFRELTRSKDHNAIAQASFSIGETLAAIGRFTFPKSGWLAPGPTVTAPLLEGNDPTPRFVDLCLASKNLRQRMPTELRNRIHDLILEYAPRFAALDSQARLVHGDFGKRNLLVHQKNNRWSVAAVLDWEFAIASSPLCDLGHFLRYERVARPRLEPHFSNGYLHSGATLPTDWRRLARLLDLTALCESLTHDELPDAVVTELVELIRATVENRDPSLP